MNQWSVAGTPNRSESYSRATPFPRGQEGLGVPKAWNLLSKKFLLDGGNSQNHGPLHTQEERGHLGDTQQPLAWELLSQPEVTISPETIREEYLHLP